MRVGLFLEGAFGFPFAPRKMPTTLSLLKYQEAIVLGGWVGGTHLMLVIPGVCRTCMRIHTKPVVPGGTTTHTLG